MTKKNSTILILGFSHSLVQFMRLKGSWFGLKYSISSLFRHPQYPHFSMFTVIILIESNVSFSVMLSLAGSSVPIIQTSLLESQDILIFMFYCQVFHLCAFILPFFALVWFLKNFDQSCIQISERLT